MDSRELKSDIIVAIDGHSSCGKSTFAKAIAAKLGYIFIDTGAMYRAVTLFALRRGVASGQCVNIQGVIAILDEVDISFRFNAQRGASDVYINGECVEDQIRGLEVTSLVSSISSIAEVRQKLTLLQQQMGEKRGIVMDGRDIGTAVFPDAEIKIFMTAQSSVRAERRYLELKGKGEDVSFEQIEQNIIARDYADENRDIAPLRKAEDAITLDNSFMTLEEQMVWFEQELKRCCNG